MVEGDAADIARAQDLLDRFLARRGERTAQAYRVDIEDFARSTNESPAGALVKLLAHGPIPGRQLVLEFAAGLREVGRAQSTVNRRLATLHALAAEARADGLVAWTLALPAEDEITEAVERRLFSASYMLPRHPHEVDRLDLQHHAIAQLLGAHYLAPVAAPAWVLDSGAGTGQWGFDVLHRFPEARVAGFDLMASKPGSPAGYHSVRGNLLDGLPFRAERFDFVHQRLLVVGVPVASWPAVVADLVRITRPGGWVELFESTTAPERIGPANERLTGWVRELGRQRGLDTGRVVFESLDGYLRDAGLADVTRWEMAAPLGQWGGPVGTLLATDIRVLYTRICEALHASGRLPEAEARDLVEGAQDEWEEHRTTWSLCVACGRKP